jgi:hypothetical protein
MRPLFAPRSVASFSAIVHSFTFAHRLFRLLICYALPLPDACLKEQLPVSSLKAPILLTP